MEEIIYKVEYSDKEYSQAIRDQDEAIDLYINNINTKDYKIEQSNPLKNVHSFDRKIDKMIDSMKEHDCLTISHLNILGNSIHRILKRVDTLYFKKCRLYVIIGNIHIDPNDTSSGIYLILGMYKISKALNDSKTKEVKKKLKFNGTKTGRVAGKTYKSKFDQFKRKIMTMYSKGISKKKICETIGTGTPQAIGKYIKAIKEKELTKKPKKRDSKKAYIVKKVNDEVKFNI
ncbi:recombinase family protein [Sulfuricurvum sp.]|uniref:recombinase family protein n=1 Tax=Sulfuricurvum sp. TaxID=2025608 RepID=UPI0035672AE4